MKTTKNLLIVHGYKLQKSGEVSLVLKKRLDKALDIINSQAITEVLLLGGVSKKNQLPESMVMKSYLQHYHPHLNIMTDDKSINTLQNVIQAKQKLSNKNFDNFYVVAGEHMMKRTKMLYQKFVPNYYSKISWVNVRDGYDSIFEPLWLIINRLILSVV